MVKSKGFRRHDALSLNPKWFKDSLAPQKELELSVVENGIDISKQNRSISAWMLSAANNVSLSCNKLGKPLLKKRGGGFILDDPHMHQSRFFVEYHRLQDPALRRYLNSVPIRKRLRELGFVTKENHVISTTKEFAEYMRYLDRIKAIEKAETLTNIVCYFCQFFNPNRNKHELTYWFFFQKETRLSTNLQKVKIKKDFESQFTGIFRRKKYKSAPNSMRPSFVRTFSKESHDMAVERAESIKEKRMNEIKHRNNDKENKFHMNMLKIMQNENK